MKLRVVALTVDPNLSVALTMIQGWDIRQTDNIFTAAKLSLESDVVVVGMGGTEQGITVVEELKQEGLSIPVLVVGDTPPEDDTRVHVPVILLPFTIDDILQTVTDLTGRAGLADEEDEDALDEIVVEGSYEVPLRLDADPVEVDAAPPPRDAVAPEPVEPSTGPVSPPAATAPQRQIPQPKSQESAPQSKRRFRRAAAPEETPVSGPASSIDNQIGRALSAAAEIESLLKRLPMLGDRAVLAEALLGEVREQLDPQIAVVLVRRGDWLVTQAGHGLTRTEATMKVAIEQPLVVQLLTTMEAVFIAPVDLARGLLTGIPGTRTEALVAAPIGYGGDLHGIIVAGNETFTDRSLDVIDDLAKEAAPGLAVARAIESLRAV